MLCAFSGMWRFGIAASLLSLGAIDFGLVVNFGSFGDIANLDPRPDCSSLPSAGSPSTCVVTSDTTQDLFLFLTNTDDLTEGSITCSFEAPDIGKGNDGKGGKGGKHGSANGGKGGKGGKKGGKGKKGGDAE